MTSNIFGNDTKIHREPQQVVVVRPKMTETLPVAVANIFIVLPLQALVVWATFLGVGNELLGSDVGYWQALLLTVGIRYLRGGNGHLNWTRKNPADK